MTLCVRMLKNHTEAEDALQESFIRAYNALGKFEARSSFSTWFYRIVYNVCAGELRKRDVEFTSSDSDEEFEIESNEWIADTMLQAKELDSIIECELMKLPSHFASILTLYYVNDMSYDEICSISQQPIGTVKTHLFRARMKLRKAVEKHYHISVEVQEKMEGILQ